MSAPSRLLLADDHAPTRAGVRLALESDGFDVVGEAASASVALTTALATRPDVCLLDIYMPGGGIEAARTIRRELPQAEIVMLTVSATDDDLFAALSAGASGYLLKTIAADRLGPALRAVLAGEAALPRALTARLIKEFHARSGRTSERWGGLTSTYGLDLTAREAEVAELLLEDLSTVQIAQRLVISEVTVRRHISAIVRKAGASDRRDALGVLRRRRSPRSRG